jgi:endonuclease/exonuclease/phosphatase family metal-dependent hydrolase
MTLNMRGFFEWDERANRIADYIKKENPDIVFFQEVVYLPEESPYTQVSLLNRELKYPYYQGSITRLQESPHYEVYREGLATLSRYPLVSSESIVLKQEEGDPHNRLVQLFDIAIDESIVKFANVHLSVRHDRALHHLQEVFGILEQRHEKRIIIGDFNITYGAITTRFRLVSRTMSVFRTSIKPSTTCWFQKNSNLNGYASATTV